VLIAQHTLTVRTHTRKIWGGHCTSRHVIQILGPVHSVSTRRQAHATILGRIERKTTAEGSGLAICNTYKRIHIIAFAHAPTFIAHVLPQLANGITFERTITPSDIWVHRFVDKSLSGTIETPCSCGGSPTRHNNLTCNHTGPRHARLDDLRGNHGFNAPSKRMGKPT